MQLQSLGRVVQMDVTLKSICPGKRVAATVILTEIYANQKEHNRGIKHLLIPLRDGTTCEDLPLRCIQFSVPEAVDPDGSYQSICNARRFQARVIANYVDSDFTCCNAEIPNL